MSSKGAQGSLTKELNESVTNLLGHNMKISLKCLIKQDLKGDKFEHRVLAFSACRLFILSAKIPTKIEQTFHYLDIECLESNSKNHLSLTVNINHEQQSNNNTKTYSFSSIDQDGEEINLIIIQLGTAMKTIFPLVSLNKFIKKFIVLPESRLKPMLEYNEAIELKARDYLFLTPPNYGAANAATSTNVTNNVQAATIPADLTSSHSPNTLTTNTSISSNSTSITPVLNPCGNFSTQYACMCDYFNLPYREEVSWDVDTIYFTHNIRELSLLDFEHLDSKDLIPIIAALGYNGWFTKFRSSGVKILGGGSGVKHDPEVAEQVICLMRNSTNIEEIYLDNTGIKADFANRLMNAIISNGSLRNGHLHTIDLSHNNLEDKGIKGLASLINKSAYGLSGLIDVGNGHSHHHIHHYKGLVHLNLSHIGLNSRGIGELSEALQSNKILLTSLTYLNLSENILKDDTKLLTFLAQPNNIVTLDLSATDSNLDTIFGALLRGCTQKLAHLNLSRNQFSLKRCTKDTHVLPSFKSFFTSAVSIKSINLSSIKLPIEALKCMLLGLACNQIASDVYLNLSSNDLKSNGASVLELVIPEIRCLSGIDLSDNSFDIDVSNVITALSKNKSLKRLSIGKNFNNIKPKNMPRILESLVLLLQEEDSSLESLSIADSKLRTDTCLIINALSNNQSLINIDITGNLMGLPGAKTLAKALQVNSKLESIYMDRNNIPTIGFIDIAYALERNFTLRYLPIPIQDITAAAKFGTPEKTEAAIAKIEELLRRNNSPNKNFLRNSKSSHFNTHNHHQQYLSYDGTFQLIDKLMVHLQDILTNLSIGSNSGSFRLKKSADGSLISDTSMKTEQIHKAEIFIKEAISAKQLYSKLYQQFIIAINNNNLDTTSAAGASLNQNQSTITSKPVDSKIREFINELKETLETHVQDTTALMLQTVQELCPNIILNSEKLQHDLQRIHSSSTNSRHFPSLPFLQSCFIEQIGSMINVKLEEVLMNIATTICDRVLDEVIESLSSSHRLLTEGGLNSVYNSNSTLIALSERSSTPDVLRNPNRNVIWYDGNGSSHDSSLEFNLSTIDSKAKIASSKEDNDNFGLATPKLSNQKRNSLYNRRLRPQSVMDGLISDDTPDLLPKAESSSFAMDSSQSSYSSISKLEHLGKSRPKRPKTRAPTRITVVQTGTVGNEIEAQEEHSISENLDQGLDTFFRKPTVDIISVQPATRNVYQKTSEKMVKNIDKQSDISSEMSVSLISENPLNNSQAAANIISKLEEVTRSRSSPNLGNRKQQSQQVQHVVTPETPRTASPGAEEIVNILNARVNSPVPVEQHLDLLAEMKAKGGKRSLAPTPTLSLDESSTSSSVFCSKPSSVQTTQSSYLPYSTSPPKSLPLTSSTNPTVQSVKLRATVFGESVKSPTKVTTKDDILSHPTNKINCKVSLLNSGNTTNSNNNNLNSNNTSTTNNNNNSNKPRPKSVVGSLGAKFSLPSESTVDQENSESCSISESSKSERKKEKEIENRGQVRKTLAVFSGNNSNTSNSSTTSDHKQAKSKFFSSK